MSCHTRFDIDSWSIHQRSQHQPYNEGKKLRHWVDCCEWWIKRSNIIRVWKFHTETNGNISTQLDESTDAMEIGGLFEKLWKGCGCTSRYDDGDGTIPFNGRCRWCHGFWSGSIIIDTSIETRNDTTTFRIISTILTRFFHCRHPISNHIWQSSTFTSVTIVYIEWWFTTATTTTKEKCHTIVFNASISSMCSPTGWYRWWYKSFK